MTEPAQLELNDEYQLGRPAVLRIAENARSLPNAEHLPTNERYKRMEAAWRALAAEQDWLDGEGVAGHEIMTASASRCVSL